MNVGRFVEYICKCGGHSLKLPTTITHGDILDRTICPKCFKKGRFIRKYTEEEMEQLEELLSKLQGFGVQVSGLGRFRRIRRLIESASPQGQTLPLLGSLYRSGRRRRTFFLAPEERTQGFPYLLTD